MERKKEIERVRQRFREKFRDYIKNIDHHGEIEKKIDIENSERITIPIYSSKDDENSALTPLDMHVDDIEFVRKIAQYGKHAKEVAEEVIDEEFSESLQVGFKNLSEVREKSVSEIRDDLGELYTVSGMVTLVSDVGVQWVKTVWKCLACDSLTVERENPETEPLKCSGCDKSSNKTAFEKVKELSESTSVQWAKIQDSNERNTNIAAKKVRMKAGLVGHLKGGEKVKVTGIVDSKDRNGGEEEIYIEALNIEKEGKEFKERNFKEERIKEIKRFSQKHDFIPYVADKIAHHLKGVDIEKKTVLAQQFKGNERSHARADGHIMMIGDPGTGKTDLARAMELVSGKIKMVEGGGSTGTSLTAAAIQEDSFNSSGYTIQAGPIALYSGGTVIIDEFDKLSSRERKKLSGAMGSDQKIRVEKGGQSAEIEAKTSILAMANPQHGRFNFHENFWDQVDFEENILNRFDIIFVLRDTPGEEDDGIAESILKNSEHLIDPELDIELVQDYIAYARKLNPTMSGEAKEKLKEFYMTLRENEKERGVITNRQLQGLKRFSEMHAKSRLAETVEVEDAAFSIRVFKEYLDRLDAIEGLDLEKIETGISREQRTTMAMIRDIIRTESEFPTDTVPEDKLITVAEELGKDREEVKKELKRMRTTGQIFEPESNKYALA